MPTCSLLQSLEAETVTSLPAVSANGEEHRHRIEPELRHACIPRLARLRPETLALRRFLHNVGVVFLGLLIYLGGQAVDRSDRLLAKGKTVPAVIYEEAGMSENGTASFHFESDSGTTYGEVKVSPSQGEMYRTGTVILVTYLPDTHGEIWQLGDLDGDQVTDIFWHWCRICTAFVAVYGTMVAVLETRWKRQLRMLREGVAVSGLVRSATTADTFTPMEHRVRYTYWVGSGVMTGSAAVGEEQYRLLTQENPYFTVLYDASDSSISCPYSQCNAAYLVVS